MAAAQKVVYKIAEVYKSRLFYGFLSNSEHLNRDSRLEQVNERRPLR
jgi:hypothetical protein